MTRLTRFSIRYVRSGPFIDNTAELRAHEKLSRGAAIEAVDRMRGVALDAAVTRYAMN